MFALSEDINCLFAKKEHFFKALNLIKPIITKEMINYYKEFSEKAKI